METRASTRTRLSVLPVFIAFVLNVMAPVITTALPNAAPEALSPQAATAAADPRHVNVTLQGCRNPSVDLELTNFVCADGDYTGGNLGKTWNELDLVPHRLTTSLGSQSAATETYTVAIVADHIEAGKVGYDIISVPVVNAAKSDASCSVAAGAQLTVTPGIGGTDTSMYRLLDISQAKGTTCVFDYYERLAVGAAQYPGSSLHSNLTNQNLGTAGVGAQDVSIPVRQIEPQALSKTMSATRGQSYPWTVTKSAAPTSLHFANTCLDTPSAFSQQVQITVTWTRGTATASGATTITTEIYATNPAHRTVTVDVTDLIYEGLTQTDQISQATSGPVDVPAASTMLVLTHSFPYNGSATNFNDVATATYTDKVTGIPVPGQTTATASAATQASSGQAANSSVLVTDSESITGTGLTFAVGAPASGAFTNYTAGTSTTGPVDWEQTVGDSGSVTFTKTVTVDEPRITSGSLTDTARIFGDGNAELSSDSESVAITADALVTLTISKTIPAGSLRSGESVTFDFSVTGPDGPHAASIAFNHGDPLTKTTTLTDLAPGSYTVSELPEPGWAGHSDQSTTITLPTCSATVSFDNSTLAPDLSITKDADDETVSAGEAIGFEIVVVNGNDPQTGPAKDVQLSDALPSGDGINWSIDSVTGTGGFSPAGDACEVTGAPGAQVLNCEFGDLAPGEGARIAISSETTAESCEVYANTAWLHASNADSISATDSTEVLCPDLELVKDGSGQANAGDTVRFTLTVTNQDDGAAKDVVLNDTLPGTGIGAWSIVDTENIDAADCVIADDVLTCSIDELAAGAWFSVTVEALTDAGACPSISNAASVSASNEPEDDQYANDDSFTITVSCPDVTVEKEAVASPISAGEQGQFSITVWNLGPGTAYDVEVVDTAPAGTTWTVLDEGGLSCSSEVSAGQQTLTCSLAELEAGEANARTILIGYTTSPADCGLLDNAVAVSASNEAAGDALNNADEASIIVECPGLNIVKTADADPIVAGEEASFTITIWNAGPGEAIAVEVHDDLPPGLSWSFEVRQGTALCTEASSVEEGGEVHQSLGCDLGTLPPSSMEGGVIIRVFAQTDRTDCGLLSNDAWAEASNNDRVSADAELTVTCPSLTIEKEADADEIVISGPNDDLQADPTVVTWTLTYTLADGPVTNVVIGDELPAGLVYVEGSASDGGVFDAATNTLTWAFATLSESGSVTFQTEVDPETISRVAPTVNVAVIASDQTPEDEGEDQVSVVVEPPPLGGTPTPRPAMPDTAMGIGINGEPITVPVELLVAVFLGSLGALALANVRTARSRRR